MFVPTDSAAIDLLKRTCANVPAHHSQNPCTQNSAFISVASNWAIGAVLRAVTEEGSCEVGFVMGKAKLSSQPELNNPMP